MPETLRQFKAGIFQALGHPTRIAIVEILRDGEMMAGRLIERLGLEQANASQHLTLLRSRGILVNRKEGSHVYYSVRDPLLFEVLDLMRAYFENHLGESLSLLQEIQQEVDLH